MFFLLLLHTISVHGQPVNYEHHEHELGLDLSFGESVISEQYISKIGFSGFLLYSHLSFSERWKQEFGLRFTNLRNGSEKEYFTYNSSKDTFRIRNWNIQLLDIPFNFKRIYTLNEKTNMFVNWGFFYSLFIATRSTEDIYLTEGEILLKHENFVYKKSYVKHIFGLDLGVGVSRCISNKSKIVLSGHLNIRSELDILGDGYFFPNVNIGYRYRL